MDEKMSKKADNIAKEIIIYQFTGKETLKELDRIFRKIMKKHKIPQGNPAYNDEGKEVGKSLNRFEWSLYKTLWLDSIKRWFEWQDLFGA